MSNNSSCQTVINTVVMYYILDNPRSSLKDIHANLGFNKTQVARSLFELKEKNIMDSEYEIRGSAMVLVFFEKNYDSSHTTKNGDEKDG